MKLNVALTCALAYCSLQPLAAAADAPPNAQAVLAQESLWLRAIARHDRTALGRILAENFVHIDYRGALRYREGELARVARAKPFAQHTSEQTVDFAGNAAVVHGLNTVSEQGRTVARLRYTDVYERLGGAWKAVSAQETFVRR